MNFEGESAFEERLRQALKRDLPGEGFTARVRRRIEARRAKRLTRYWMAVAALVAVSVGAGTAVHDYQDRRRAEATKAGFELVAALRITKSKLHATHKMILRRSNAT